MQILNLLLEFQGLLWKCGLREICLTALWLPLGALIFCYVTASIFQGDDIHETHCRVSIILTFILLYAGKIIERKYRRVRYLW